MCPTHRDEIGETIANDLSKFIHDAAAMFILLPDGCKSAHVSNCQNIYQRGRGGVKVGERKILRNAKERYELLIDNFPKELKAVLR